MSSPIVNLRKSRLPPEKIIATPKTEINSSNNGKNNQKSTEEEMDEFRKNGVVTNKRIVEEIYQRMSDLEDQVKDMMKQLTAAFTVIDLKNEEIEMLKEQLSQNGRNQSNAHLYRGNEIASDDEYLTEQNDELDEDISLKKTKKFYRKGDFISIKDGKCERRTKCRGSKDEKCGELKDYLTYEESSRGRTVRGNDQTRIKKEKKVYTADTGQLEEYDIDIDEMLSDNAENYVDNLSSRNSLRSRHSNGSDLERENSRLVGQIEEMEKFLSDYGMIWVGEKTVTDRIHGNIRLQAAVGFTPDFDKLILTIGELNQRASSEKHIKVTGNEAKFQKADMLNLTLYNDGMQLEDGPFRSFSAESAQAFFQDLGDGYYPAELKESHPEGVIFKVIDKRMIKYTESKNGVVPYNGQGYVLGTRDPSNGEPGVPVVQRQELSNHQQDLSDPQEEQSNYKKKPPNYRKEPSDHDQKPPYNQKKLSDHGQNQACNQRKLSNHDKKPADNQKNLSDHDQNPDYNQKNLSDPEQKPTYNQKKFSDLDQKPTYNQKNLSDHNQKPAYNQKKLSDHDQKPAHIQKKFSDHNQKPAHIQKKFSDHNQMPPYNQKKLSDHDQKPPYNQRNLSGHNQKPPYNQRNLSGHDQKPTYNQKNLSGHDQKPPYNQKNLSDLDQKQTYNQQEPTDHLKEYKQSLENKGTQTEMYPEEFGDNMRTKTGSQATRSHEGGSNMGTEPPVEQFRDKIEITNITYHEAPSANAGMVRRIIIVPGESQSEPVLTSPHGRRQSGRLGEDQAHPPFVFIERGPRTTQDINDEAKSRGSEESGKGQVPLISEYNDTLGRNADKVKEMIGKQDKGPISRPNFDLTKRYEHITLLGQGTRVSRDKMDKEGNEKKRSLDTDTLHSVKSIKNDTESNTIHLNQRTSNEQIQLLMLPRDGKQIYYVYVSPDDSIEKIWHLTKLSPVDFDVTTVDGKVLDKSVPLKKYNIDGDITLNIIRKDPAHKIVVKSREPSLNEDNGSNSSKEDDVDDDPPQISEPFDENSS